MSGEECRGSLSTSPTLCISSHTFVFLHTLLYFFTHFCISSHAFVFLHTLWYFFTHSAILHTVLHFWENIKWYHENYANHLMYFFCVTFMMSKSLLTHPEVFEVIQEFIFNIEVLLSEENLVTYLILRKGESLTCPSQCISFCTDTQLWCSMFNAALHHACGSLSFERRGILGMPIAHPNNVHQLWCSMFNVQCCSTCYLLLT